MSPQRLLHPVLLLSRHHVFLRIGARFLSSKNTLYVEPASEMKAAVPEGQGLTSTDGVKIFSEATSSVVAYVIRLPVLWHLCRGGAWFRTLFVLL